LPLINPPGYDYIHSTIIKEISGVITTKYASYTMKIGLFFGSFNPIHIGHLIIANTMAETTDLDEVWFVVSPQNPFKKNQSLLHEFDRYDMVSAAILTTLYSE